MAVPHSQLQSVAPGAVIELYQLELNTDQHGVDQTYYFHAGINGDQTGDLVWATRTYTRFPVVAEGFEYSGRGELPRPRLRISNVLSTITTILAGLPDGLGGAKVTRIRTLARFLDATNFDNNTNPFGTPDPTAEFPREIYFVDRKSAENREVVEFELAAIFDIAGVRGPKRQCLRNLCQWVYRSAECGWTGTNYYDSANKSVSSAAEDVCGKRLSSCKARFGNTNLPYGAFPGLGQFR